MRIVEMCNFATSKAVFILSFLTFHMGRRLNVVSCRFFNPHISYSNMTPTELDNNIPAADATQSVAKKRVRIVKRDSEHIYSASQEQGERFDSIKDEISHKRAVASVAKAERAAAIHALESEVLIPPRKNRGRPSKAYLQAQQAYEEALARQQTQIEEARAALSGTIGAVATVNDNSDNHEEALSGGQEEEIPDFILMQRQDVGLEDSELKLAKAEDNEEINENVISSDETSNLEEKDSSVPDIKDNDSDVAPANSGSEFSSVVEATDNKSHEDLLKWLSTAYASGQRFIIKDDVPTIDPEGYLFVPETSPEEEKVQHDSPLPHDVYKSEELQPYSSSSKKSSKESDNVQSQPVEKLPVISEIVIEAEGVAEIDNQGNAYLRSSDYNYMPSPDDIFVTQAQVRSYSLKMGDVVTAKVRAPREGEKYYTLKEIISINGCVPSDVRDRIAFEHLTPLFPDTQFKLSKRGEKSPMACRIVDLFAPIGKGQRALIVAQPKTGKTVLLKQIANAIAAHYPETYLMMLLIDERPEEVTDMARTVNAEVIASTFDEPAKRHVRIATMVLEKAKRMVECGHDVVIFLDSITRLARAFNTEAPTSGKILTGGVDANALQRPKRFFGAARNIENGGSLTIIATALIDTGSKMDEVIFEEFKGTGNMELQLDRALANRRIYPAVNLAQSSTRREDLLLDEYTTGRMYVIRNFMSDMNTAEAMKFLRDRIEVTGSNEEFVASVSETNP